MTPYPTFDDYCVAVSNPAHFFSDPEIRRRTAIVDSFGQPKFFAGRYAYTFRLALTGGVDPIAVRCFRQEVHDVLARYQAIDAFLGKLKSPFFVGFVVAAPDSVATAQGVLVKGKWLPAMRMDWVEGLTLAEFVRVNKHDRVALQKLRDGLFIYSQLTEQRQFAHCDIHPENIIVDSECKLRFVDYDGIFVPAIRNYGGEVVGQADYQSPFRMREPGHFGPYLDRFPLLVLDLTLAALQRNPAILAQRTDGEGIFLVKGILKTRVILCSCVILKPYRSCAARCACSEMPAVTRLRISLRWTS